MPITARLSQRFYQKLGDDVANELVEWLNAMDTSYRMEFRDLFDAHFARLDARLAQLAAEVRSEVAQASAHTEKTVLRWMFGFWIGSWAAIAGTLIALRQLGWLTGP